MLKFEPDLKTTFYSDSQSYGKKIGKQILTRFFSTKCPSLKFSENNGVNSHHCPNFALTKTFNGFTSQQKKALFIQNRKTLFMKYSVDKQEKYSVFTLHEENLNSLIAPNLKSQFAFQKDEGVNNLILDLTDVKYVDSSGLSAMLFANRLWKSDGTFMLTNMNHTNVKKLIEISKLDGVFTVIPTLDESIEYAIMDEIERELNLEQG